MLTLILVVIFTVRERYGDILDLFGVPSYGHYDDPERHIHHAFPAREAIVSPTNVAHTTRNNPNNNGGVGSNFGSGGFRCGCGCGCGCDVTGAVGAIPNVDSDADNDSLSSESNTDDEYYSDVGDLSSESGSNSDGNDSDNTDGNIGSDCNNNSDDNNTDIGIDINGVIDYTDGTISYGITRGAIEDQNNGGTSNGSEIVNSSRFGDAFVCGNNGSLTDIYLGSEVVDDSVVVSIFDLFRDIYHRTGDVCEDGDDIGDINRVCTDPFSELCHLMDVSE